MDSDAEHAKIDAEIEELKLKCSQLQPKMKRAQELRKQREEEKRKVAAAALEEAIRASQEVSLASERAARARERALDAMKACLCPDAPSTSGQKRKAVDGGDGAQPGTRELATSSKGANVENVEAAAGHLIDFLGGLEDRIVGRVIKHIDAHERSERVKAQKPPESAERQEPTKRSEPAKRPGPAKRPKAAKVPKASANRQRQEPAFHLFDPRFRPSTTRGLPPPSSLPYRYGPAGLPARPKKKTKSP